MSIKRQPHFVRSTTAHLAMALGMSMLTSAHAAQVSFQFTGVVTALSNGSPFGEVALGDEITGRLSYDTATQPYQKNGFWSAYYSLAGDSTSLSFTLPSNQTYETNSLNARVFNGPIYPHLNEDLFNLNDQYLPVADYFKKNITQHLSLGFQDLSLANGLASSHLPTSIDLSRMPFSGGTLSILSGPAPSGDEIYLINRTSNAFISGMYGGTESSYTYVQRISRSNPDAPLSSFYLEPLPGTPTNYINHELERYNAWLAAGNKPLYLDTLGFHMTSISAVPEANSVLMLLAGVAALGMARRRVG